MEKAILKIAEMMAQQDKINRGMISALRGIANDIKDIKTVEKIPDGAYQDELQDQKQRWGEPDVTRDATDYEPQ